MCNNQWSVKPGLLTLFNARASSVLPHTNKCIPTKQSPMSTPHLSRSDPLWPLSYFLHWKCNCRSAQTWPRLLHGWVRTVSYVQWSAQSVDTNNFLLSWGSRSGSTVGWDKLWFGLSGNVCFLNIATLTYHNRITNYEDDFSLLKLASNSNPWYGGSNGNTLPLPWYSSL